MPSNYKANDPYVNEQVDLDDILISDSWLVDQFVGGTLFGWSYGLNGEIGDGTIVSKSSPVQVGSLSNWRQISCGTQHTLAIKTDGTLWSWGRNDVAGNLGNGTTTNYSSPIQIGSLTNWKQVSAKGYVSAAIKTDGTLWAWGYNLYGQLGNGTTTNYSSPIQIGSLTNWKQVAMGWNHCSAIKIDGTMWTWGYNLYGELGNGTVNVYYSSPVQVGSLTNWKQVSNGYAFTTAIKTDGTLWAWGQNNQGQLGLNQDPAVSIFSTTNQSSPVQVAGGTTWATTDPDTQILSYGNGVASAFIKYDGSLWTCGYNRYGNLGNGTAQTTTPFSIYSSPIQVGSLTNWKQVYFGSQTTAAVKTDGSLWTWGRNNQGNLGNGTTINYSSPIQVGSLTNWNQVVASNQFLAAVKTDGTLWTCGYGFYGELGNGANGAANKYSSPIQVGSLTNWKQVCLGKLTVSALKTDGTLWAWGNSQYGQLGNGTTLKYSSPIQVGSLTIWSKLACGYATLAIKTDGTLWAWGRNNYGQIGNNTTTDYSSPVQIGALTDWKQVASSDVNVAAIKTDGTLWTWGFNDFGGLGNGTTIAYSSPIQVGSITTWKQVVCGYGSTFAYKSDGTLWACGYNNKGQLGAPSSYTNNISSPIQVGSLTNWKQVSNGYNPMLIKTDGTLWGCGYNLYGGLGNGSTNNYSSPIQIGTLTNWKHVATVGYGGGFVAIKTDGTLWTCGYNGTFGRIGNGTTIHYSSPVQVGSLTNWKQASCGNAPVNAITFKDLG